MLTLGLCLVEQRQSSIKSEGNKRENIWKACEWDGGHGPAIHDNDVRACFGSLWHAGTWHNDVVFLWRGVFNIYYRLLPKIFIFIANATALLLVFSLLHVNKFQPFFKKKTFVLLNLFLNIKSLYRYRNVCIHNSRIRAAKKW